MGTVALPQAKRDLSAPKKCRSSRFLSKDLDLYHIDVVRQVKMDGYII
jgi:hypothetical protein